VGRVGRVRRLGCGKAGLRIWRSVLDCSATLSRSKGGQRDVDAMEDAECQKLPTEHSFSVLS
jgi:hypothetical protein